MTVARAQYKQHAAPTSRVSKYCSLDESCNRGVCTTDFPVKNKQGNVHIISN